MTLEQRMRAIRLIEMIEREPQMARDLGITVRQKLVSSEEEKRDKERGSDEARRS